MSDKRNVQSVNLSFLLEELFAVVQSRRHSISDKNVLTRLFFLKSLDPAVFSSIYQALETHLQVRDSIAAKTTNKKH